MRYEGACLGRDADAREQLVDLAVQRRDLRVRLDPGPDHVRASVMLEQIDPRDPGQDGGGVQRTECGGDIFGAVMVDFADEAQSQVQLVVDLPARARNAVHRGDQRGADGVRRAQRDEQAVGRHWRTQHKRLRWHAESLLSGFA